MRITALASVFALALALVALAPSARAQTGTTSTYKLESDSRFETGCFGMCLCAVVTHPLKGTFFLTHTGFDPLYDYYDVSNVSWVVSDSTNYFTITGSGTYKIGGEFALVNEMVLDLSVNGGANQHFDSGLVPISAKFPQILVDVSLHQNTACVDTLLHLDATDPVATSVDVAIGGSRVPWVKAAPNPFRDQAAFSLALPRSSRVDVTIYDARGRAVRHLRTGWLTAGLHTMAWDGRRDSGSSCASGLYFVGARVGGERITSRIVKLD